MSASNAEIKYKTDIDPKAPVEEQQFQILVQGSRKYEQIQKADGKSLEQLLGRSWYWATVE